LVISPDEAQAAQKIRRLADVAEGAVLIVSDQLRQLRLGAITDCNTFVPETFTRMQELLRFLGFQPEPAEFKPWWKRLGG